MREKKPCPNGNFAARDNQRHCLCAACKKQACERRAAWRRANPERAKEYSRKWIAANPGKRKAVVEAWRERNPDKVAAMSAKAGRKWSKANPGKRNAITNRRRAALKQRTAPWADIGTMQALYVEAARLTEATGIPHEVDHIFPLQGELISGLHVAENLQILTRSENRAKQNRVQS